MTPIVRAATPDVQRGWMRWAVAIIALLTLSIPAAGYAYLYQQSEKLIFYKYGEEGWAKERPGSCSDARKYYFSDLRPTVAEGKVLEMSCEKGEKYTYLSMYPKSRDGIKVHAKLFKAPKPSPLLVHVPGLTSTWLDATRYIPLANRLGFQLVTLEMRNHGISGNNGKGVAYGCHEWKDVMAVLTELNTRFPQRHIYLWGSSMGASAVLNAAPHFQKLYPNVKAVVLENPFSSLRDMLEQETPDVLPIFHTLTVSIAGQRAESNFETCSPTALAGRLKLPTLVTVSQKDTRTPPEMANTVYNALPHAADNKFIVYPEGDHAAIWNGQPLLYERDLKTHWERSVPVALREAQAELLAKEEREAKQKAQKDAAKAKK